MSPHTKGHRVERRLGPAESTCHHPNCGCYYVSRDPVGKHPGGGRGSSTNRTGRPKDARRKSPTTTYHSPQQHHHPGITRPTTTYRESSSHVQRDKLGRMVMERVERWKKPRVTTTAPNVFSLRRPISKIVFRA